MVSEPPSNFRPLLWSIWSKVVHPGTNDFIIFQGAILRIISTATVLEVLQIWKIKYTATENFGIDVWALENAKLLCV